MQQRQLKFRFWNKKSKCWGAVSFSSGFINEGFWGFGNEQDFFVVQQFTGLKDSKNQEIYEGDIVKFFINGEKEKPDERISEVYFDDLRFWPEELSANCEILGNIFESNGLLKS